MDTDFLNAIEDAIELGDGYAIIQLDPDGLRVTPVMHDNANMEVGLRSSVRRIASIVWGQGRSLVAATEVGVEDVLPSSVSPSVPAPTSFLNTDQSHRPNWWVGTEAYQRGWYGDPDNLA